MGEAAMWILLGLVLGLLLGMRISSQGRSGSGRGSRAARNESRPASPGAVEIYVGNMAYDLSESDLEKLFGEYGAVEAIRIIVNKFNGKSKGYAFVTMADGKAAEQAIKALNGKEIKGRQIVANEAKARSRRDR